MDNGGTYRRSEPANETRRTVVRPPWTREESIKRNCNGCGDCIAACPEAIIMRGRANTPIVNFHLGECTYCGLCAQACSEDVFASVDTQPWDQHASISDKCLLSLGVSCQLCTDSCNEEALKIDLTQRPVGKLTVVQSVCTGCGACVAGCPVDAIEILKVVNESRTNV